MKNFFSKYCQNIKTVPQLTQDLFETLGLLLVVLLFPILYPCYQLYKKVRK